MNLGKTLFSQIMEHLPLYEFRKCVDRYNGNRKVQRFTCLDQFRCMAFAQLTYRESLRDIESCLRSVKHKLYHMGFRGKVSRNTLSNANEVRDWRIYADFAHELIRIARRLYVGEELDLELKQLAYALDSTIIDLCLSLFPWAKFRSTKAAVKLHTLLELQSSLPITVIITPGNVHDVNILDHFEFESDEIYVMDRAYCDFERLDRIERADAFFVVRAKKNLDFTRIYSHPVDKSTGLQCDQTIRLNGPRSQKRYPRKLRRVRYRDPESQKRFVFLTNHFDLPAITVANLYRCRWKIELFFKWIKQHLRIKKFYGNNENAVKTQIWIAISTYVLVAIVKKRLNINHSLYTILQILSVQIFEKTTLIEALSDIDDKEQETYGTTQLTLFD